MDEIIGTNEGLAAALRAMGNTKAAGEVMVKSGHRNLETQKTSQAEALKKELNNALKDTNRNRKKAENLIEETIKNLDYQDPQRAILENNKEAAISSMQDSLTLVEVTDNYIKQHGDEGLPFILKEYNDMKGLYGFWNFTDENAKLTREIAIMVASFIITAGASAVFNMLAAGGKAAYAASAAKAAAHWKNGNYIRSAISGSWAGTTWLGGEGANAIATGLNVANKSTLGRIVADATVFTSADTLARWAWSQEGEATTGFGSFFENVVHNAGMFGAFHGMGKFMDATTAKIAERFGVSNPSSLIGKFTLKSGETIALTAGDIAVMQGLYAAENGKLEWSSE